MSSLCKGCDDALAILTSSVERQRRTPITNSVARARSASESSAQREECSNSEAYASCCSTRSRMSKAVARDGETDMTVQLPEVSGISASDVRTWCDVAEINSIKKNPE